MLRQRLSLLDVFASSLRFRLTYWLLSPSINLKRKEVPILLSTRVTGLHACVKSGGNKRYRAKQYLIDLRDRLEAAAPDVASVACRRSAASRSAISNEMCDIL